MAQADAVREAARANITVKLDRDDIEAVWSKVLTSAAGCLDSRGRC